MGISMRELLNTKQAAPFAGATEGTLENWRTQGVGPKFIKVGRKVFYDPDDIATWRAANRYQSTSEAEAA